MLILSLYYFLQCIEGHFHKCSLIFSVSPSHKPDLLACTLLKHEDESTFARELRYVFELIDPTMMGAEGRACVFITDEDYGRINAIEDVFPNAHISLCWWHKKENIIKHFSKPLEMLAKKRKLNSSMPACSSSDISGAPASVDIASVDPEFESDADGCYDEEVLTDNVLDESTVSVQPCDIQKTEETAGSDDHMPSISDFTISSSGELFKWIRTASSLIEVNARLDKLVSELPSCANYVNGHLRPTVQYWVSAMVA